MSDASLTVDLSLISAGFRKGMADARQDLVNFGHAAESMLTKIAAAAGLYVIFESLSKGILGATDNVQKLSQALEGLGGGNFARFQELTQAANKFGLTTDQVTGSMSKLKASISSNSLTDLKAFYNIGIDPSKLEGLSATEQYTKVAEALSRVKDQSERTSLGVQLLGESFRSSAKFLNSDINGSIAAFDKLGTGLTNLQEQNIEKMTQAKNQLSTIFSSLGEKIVADLAPAFTRLFNYITETIARFGGIDAVAQKFADAFLSGIGKIEDGLRRITLTYQTFKNIAGLTNEPSVLSNKASDWVSTHTFGGTANANLYAYKDMANLYKYKQLPGYHAPIPTGDANGGVSTAGSSATPDTPMQSYIVPLLSMIPKFTGATQAAASALTEFATVAKQGTDAFTKGFEGLTGKSEQISRILNGASGTQAVSKKFDDEAASILKDLQHGANPYGANIQSRLNYLDSYSHGDHNISADNAQDKDGNDQWGNLKNTGQAYAVSQLRDYITNHYGKKPEGSGTAMLMDSQGAGKPNYANYHPDSDRKKYLQGLAEQLGDKDSKTQTTTQLNEFLKSKGLSENKGQTKIVVEPSPLFKVTVLQYGKEAAQALAESEARGVSN